MTRLPAWNELLRSKTAAALTLVCGAVVGLLMLQALAGWPFHRTVALRVQPAEHQAPGIYRARIPRKIATLDWNAPLVRAFVNGVEFDRHKNIGRIATAQAPASTVEGRTVYLRDPNATDPLVGCEIRTPWLPNGGVSIVAVAVLFALGGLTFWARNPWLLRWRQKLRRVPVAAGLLAGLLVSALLVRIAGFSFPSWENDSDDYFRPVFQWLSGLPITPTDRPLGYPVFIAAALATFRDFRALLVLNMTASVCAATAMGCVFFACARRLFVPGTWRFVARAAGILATGYFVLNERVLQREWLLLPEALAAAWLGGQLWLAWRLMAKRLSPRRALWEFGCFCALGWLIFFTKSNWGFAVGLLPLPMLCRALLRSTSRREVWRQLAAGAAVFLGVAALAYGFQRLTPQNTAASVEIRSRVLVCWHVDLVRPEIARRLATDPPPAEAALLREFAGLLDAELAQARTRGAGAYETLGYDGDRLYYYGFAGAKLYRQLASGDRAAFCRGLFFGALQRKPGIYVRKVARQWALYFAEPYANPVIRLPDVADSLELSEKFVARPPAYLPRDLRENYQPVVKRARAEFEDAWPSPVRHALSLRLKAATAFLNPAFRWLLGIPLLVTVVAALWPAWRAAVPWRRLGPVLGLALWATGSAAACTLTSSALQALEVQRYIDLFLPLTVILEFLWPFIALLILRRLPVTALLNRVPK